MKYQQVKGTLTSLALPVFFGGGLLLSLKSITHTSAWDYIVIQLLAIMNGLGLSIVLVLWTVHILGRRTEARHDLPARPPKPNE